MSQGTLPGVPVSADGLLDFTESEIRTIYESAIALDSIVTNHDLECRCATCRAFHLLYMVGRLSRFTGERSSEADTARTRAIQTLQGLNAGRVIRRSAKVPR